MKKAHYPLAATANETLVGQTLAKRRQISGTDPLIKVLRQGHHWVWGLIPSWTVKEDVKITIIPDPHLNDGEVGAQWNRFKPFSKILLLTVPRRCFFCGSFVLFLSCVCYAFARVCWHMASLLALVCDAYLCCRHFPMWYPSSGVLLDYIVSWSWPSFLLL